MMTVMEFDLEITRGSGRTCVQLRGELDLSSGPALEAQLAELRERREAVTLDLSQLAFMDSAGLVTILGSVQAARAAATPLEIDRTLQPAVQRLFALTRTDEFLWPPARTETAC